MRIIRSLVWLSMVVAACGTPYAVRYVVKAGDTVDRVARQYGVDESELRNFNRLQAGDRLRPGDVVFIPGDRRPRPAAVEQPKGKDLPVQSPASAKVRVRAAPPPVEEPPARSTAGRRSQWVWPVPGEILVGYGAGPAGESRGLDLAAPAGSEVRAAEGGDVTYAGSPAPAYGSIVILEHSPGLFTVYANLGRVRVEKGQRLGRGEALGTVGGAGNGKPPHFHFEVRRNEKPVDPLLFLPAR